MAGQSNIPKKTVTHSKPFADSNVAQKPAVNAANTAHKFTTNIGQKPTTHKAGTNDAQKLVPNVTEKITSSNAEKLPSNIATEKVESIVTEKSAVDKPVAVAKVAPIKLKPPPRVSKSSIKKDEKTEVPNKNVNIRHSVDLEKSEDSSLYVSALEDVTDSTRRTRRSSNNKVNKTCSVLYHMLLYFNIKILLHNFNCLRKFRDSEFLAILFNCKSELNV